jgi:CDGSH-type Zn-finger protein
VAAGDEALGERKIAVTKDAPRPWCAGPWVAKTQIVSEHGEPLAWRKDRVIDTQAHALCQMYSACRRGHSSDKPFCTGMHAKVGSAGAEAADTQPIAARQATFPDAGPLGRQPRRHALLSIGLLRHAQRASARPGGGGWHAGSASREA